MKLTVYSFLFAVLIFLSFPFFIFYMAFYSNSLYFKDFINNHVEIFYFLFMVFGVSYSYIFTKIFFSRKDIKKKHKLLFIRIFEVFILLYAIFLIINTMSRFSTYRSEAIDVVFFRREIWQLSQFQIPEWAWAQHFSPILYLFVPFFWIIKSGSSLMFMQSVFVISGIVPLYLSAKTKLKSKIIGLALAFSYLLFGGLQVGYAYGFHEIMMIPPLLFWLYYFYLKDKKILYYLFLFLSLGVKEEVSFIVIFWGLYLLYKKKYRYGLTTLLLGVFWYILCFFIIFPYFNKGVGFGYWGQYDGSSGLSDIAKRAFSNPLYFIKSLLTPKYKFDTILHSFGNFSFLSFLYLPSLIIVFPSLMEKLLSNNIAAKNGFHYSAAITAVVLISAIEALYIVKKRKTAIKYITSINVFIAILIVYVAFSANMIYGYHPISPLVLGKEPGLTPIEIINLNNVIETIPESSTISAQYYIRSHINRPYWLILGSPQEEESADFVIINTKLPLIMSERDNLENNVEKLMNNDDYEIVENKYSTILFKRIEK